MHPLACRCLLCVCATVTPRVNDKCIYSHRSNVTSALNRALESVLELATRRLNCASHTMASILSAASPLQRWLQRYAAEVTHTRPPGRKRSIDLASNTDAATVA
jgi:lysyl-tRNA synthetase class I